MKEVGKVTHYFDKIGVAIVELSGSLNQDDEITIKGKEEFSQKVSSMQLNHEVVTKAKSGDVIGLKVDKPVREGDKIHLA